MLLVNRHILEDNRVQKKTHMYGQLIFNKGDEAIKWEGKVFSTIGAGTSEHLYGR